MYTAQRVQEPRTMSDHPHQTRRSTRSDQAVLPRGPKVPAYRQRAGYDQAIVTLTDALTKKRRDFWLGPYGSPESRECYHRVIAEWEGRGRRLPPRSMPSASVSASPGGQRLTINELILEYWAWATPYYSASELAIIRSGLRILREHFGSTPAEAFGPNRLRVVREAMIRGKPEGPHPREPWVRTTINGQIHRVCRLFKWAASHEMLPATVYQQLKTVPALRRGRSPAPEPRPVGPVSTDFIERARPFLSRQVDALVQLQLLTGARGGELFTLRAIDILIDDRSGIWTIEPADHKTSHHGHARTIFLGPRSQEIIRPFLTGRPLDACLFSPAEAEAERLQARAAARRTPLSCGNVPGSNRVATPRKAPGEHYTASSYRRAIQRATEQAFPPPEHLRPRILPNGRMESLRTFRARLTAAEKLELAAWHRHHNWHPHQLRHTAATIIRREFGLEAARIALGHSSALVTDAVYAERDRERVVEVMRKIG